MRSKILIPLVVVLAFGAGYGYRHWFGGDAPPVAAKSERKVLYYHDPMHPSYKSDKPGIAPDCNMPLVPVYADENPDDPEDPAAVPGAVHISPEKQQLIGVEYGTVDYGPVSKAVKASAKIAVDESKLYRVQSKMEGWIDDVFVTLPGTYVKKNQPLLTVYNPMSLAIQYDLIKHAGSNMHMGSPQPSKNLPANTPSAASGSQTNDQALFESDKFRLQYMGFDDELIMTIARSGTPIYKLPVYSPVDGFVLERNALPKQKMTPDTLYSIADLSTVFVIADVFEHEGPAVKVGQSAVLTIPYLPGRSFRGKVDSILPQVDPTTRTLKVRMVFDNRKYELKPEMYGEVQFNAAGASRLTVPQTAVLDSGVRRVVFVDRGNGFFEPRQVDTGQQFGDRVEIISGLKAGERIVTSGNFLIDSESRLRAGRGGYDRSHH
jgi:Cu(I)/Ag(I) efflux system membrane fusion protein